MVLGHFLGQLYLGGVGNFFKWLYNINGIMVPQFTVSMYIFKAFVSSTLKTIWQDILVYKPLCTFLIMLAELLGQSVQIFFRFLIYTDKLSFRKFTPTTCPTFICEIFYFFPGRKHSYTFCLFMGEKSVYFQCLFLFLRMRQNFSHIWII